MDHAETSLVTKQNGYRAMKNGYRALKSGYPSKRCYRLSLIVGLVFTASCSLQSAAVSESRDALILGHNEDSLELIHEGLSKLLNGTRVQALENPFTESSLLSIHRSTLTGRDFGTPDLFRLVKNSEGCFLIYENTGERERLETLDCIYN